MREDERGHELRTLQLGFIGKIIASFTHELKNHLAIVKESAGLQQDMITFAEKKPKIDPDELMKFLKSIDDELERTLSVITFLNRYAHRMDNEESNFSVNDVLEELIALTDRLARQKRISLSNEFDPELPAIFNNPSRLQLVIFCLIENMLKSLEQRSTLLFRTGLSGDGVVISLIPKAQGAGTIDETKWPWPAGSLEELVRGISGTISREGQSGEITIRLPLSKAPV